MAFRIFVILCLAATAGGIMMKGASEGSLPSQRRVARHRAAKDSDSEGLANIIADAVEGLAEGIMDVFGEADEADETDETEMHKSSSDEEDEADETETRITSHEASSDEADELESDDVDEDDEDEGELSPAERQVMSALQEEYGGRLEKVLGIMDRGLAPDASEDDKERAEEYVDKTTELVEAVDASSATSAPEDAPGAEEEEKAADEAEEVVKKVAHGVGTIVDAVAPVATELLDAVFGDDEDED